MRSPGVMAALVGRGACVLGSVVCATPVTGLDAKNKDPARTSWMGWRMVDFPYCRWVMMMAPPTWPEPNRRVAWRASR